MFPSNLSFPKHRARWYFPLTIQASVPLLLHPLFPCYVVYLPLSLTPSTRSKLSPSAHVKDNRRGLSPPAALQPPTRRSCLSHLLPSSRRSIPAIPVAVRRPPAVAKLPPKDTRALPVSLLQPSTRRRSIPALPPPTRRRSIPTHPLLPLQSRHPTTNPLLEPLDQLLSKDHRAELLSIYPSIHPPPRGSRLADARAIRGVPPITPTNGNKASARPCDWSEAPQVVLPAAHRHLQQEAPMVEVMHTCSKHSQH